MSIISSGSFVAATNKTAGTTFVFTSSLDIKAGDLAVLFVGTDNLNAQTSSNNIISVTDNLLVGYNFQQGTGFDNTVKTITSQSNGQILAGGDFTVYNNVSASRLIRLNSDGTVDSTFSSNLDSAVISGSVYKLAIQNITSASISTDKILAVGQFGIARLNDDGTTDVSFENNLGANTNNTACTVLVENTSSYTLNGNSYNDKIILGGIFTQFSGSTYSGSVKLNGDGTVDTSFNIGTGFSGSADVRDLKIYSTDISVWNFGGALITARYFLAGAGIQNEALAFGGVDSAACACTEEYNGISWSTGGSLITARYSLGGAGTQNEALAFGGFGVAECTCTEEYNGTSWSAGGALITARAYLAGAGTQNEALAFGGGVSVQCDCTEEYNGTSWSTGGNLITARCVIAGTGAQNAALAFGGTTPPTCVGCTEEYDGSVWISSNSLIVARYGLAGTGTQNEALAFGGTTNVTVSCTEEYNGTSWTVKTALITPKYALAGAGTQNSALAMAGFPTSTVSEEYNKVTPIIAVGNFTGYSGSIRNRIALINLSDGTVIPTSSFNIGAGFNSTVNSIAIDPDNKIVAVGNFTTYSGSNATRIARLGTTGIMDTGSAFNTGTGLNAEGCVVCYTLRDNVWSVGGTMSVTREYLAGAGIQNEALGFGGTDASPCVSTEEYNGTSWSSGGNLINAAWLLAGAGTQNEALAFGGFANTNLSCTEEYNGTSWSAGGALITARSGLAGSGTQNAGLAFGSPSSTEEYNGTSWSSGGTLISSRTNLAGAGTQNEALAIGGATPTSVTCTEEYNGTLWSSGGALITARNLLAGAGTQDAALAFGGVSSPVLNCTEEYNGSSWSTTSPLISIRCSLGGAGTQDAALAFGGNSGISSIASAEEYSLASSYYVGGIFTAYSGSTNSGSVLITNSGLKDTTYNIGLGFTDTTDVDGFLIDTTNSKLITVGGFTSYSASFSPPPNRIIQTNLNGVVDATSIGNTWDKTLERSDGSAAGAGATIAMFYISPTLSTIPSGITLTATLSGSVTAKSATGWIFGTTSSLTAVSGSVSSSAAAGTSDPPAMRLSGSLTGSEQYLFIRGIAYENLPTLTFTQTTNFSTMSAAGTTGGTAITNISVVSEFRIVTTSSLISDPSLSTATSNANIFYVFYENSAAVISGTKTYFILID